ncbi:MAG: DUF2341 domain-containing protein [Balneolaceae bacterium]|nr:DUF2341 domain-containing protein [Balneolaceae bacterium]
MFISCYRRILFMIVAVFLLIPEIITAQVSGYSYRKKFVIDAADVTSNLTDFPVLVSLTDTDFRSTANGGRVENSNGYDIVFTSSDGSTQLNHEMEAYDASTGEIRFWVRFSSLSSSSNTEFYIYYGKSGVSDQSTASTWNSDYLLVYHMDDSGSQTDATSNSHDATYDGTTSTTGAIGDGRNFSSEYIEIPDQADLRLTSDITISMWINGSNLGSTGPDLITKGSYTEAYSAYFFSEITFRDNGGNTVEGSSLSDGTQYYLTFTNDGSSSSIYLDGNEITYSTNDGPLSFNGSNTNPLYISSNGTYAYSGMMDEVRLSQVARSAGWIETEYTNQSDPANFYTEEAEAPVLSSIEGSDQSFTIGGSAVFVTNTIQTSAPFLPNLESATIQITSNYISGDDVLNFTDTGSITGSWDSGTGTLTLSGTATLAEYQTALRSITYENTGSDYSTRTVSFTVSDIDNSSNTVSRDIIMEIVISDPATSLGTNVTVFHMDAQDADGDGDTGTNQPADGALSTWGDRSDDVSGGSTTDIDFTAPGGDEPVLDAGYFGERGGLFFDGSTSNYQGEDDNILNTSSFTEKSFALVFRTGNSTSGLQTIYEQGGGVRGYNFSINDGTLYAYAFSGDWASENHSINLGSVSTNETYIVVATHDASTNSWKARVNSGSFSELTGAETMNSHSGDPTIGEEDGTRSPVTFSNPGGTNNFNGYMAELISWNVVLEDGIAESIYDHFCDKWCNDPPVIAGIEGTNLDYTESDPAKIVTSSLTVSDSDNTVLDSAKVSITTGFVSTEDVLSFTATGSITGSYDSGTGILSLSGTDTKANYQTVLRSVTYENTNDDDPSLTSREIEFVVYDWDDSSNAPSRTVNIIGVNDTPSLSGITGSPVTYNEGDGASTLPITVSISDVDDANMESAEIAITSNYTLGEDELDFTDQLGISGSWNSASGTLTLSGTSSASNYETALEAVTYENTSSDPVELTRTISFTVNDGDNDSNTESRDVDVVASNSKPVLSAIESSDLEYPGSDVIITSTVEVTDPDNTLLDSAFVEITSNYLSSEDELVYSTLFGITGSWNSTTGRLKLEGTNSLSDYQAALRSVEYRNNAGIPSGSSREVSFSAHDGDLESNVVSRTVNVSAVEAISGLDVWLRADLGLITSGSEVVTWEDQSGNGNDYTGVSDAGTRPTTVASSGALNSQPAVDFAGDGDHFEDSDGETNYINGNSEFTMFVVIKSDQTGTDRGIFIAQPPDNDDKYLTIRYDAAGANNDGSFTDVVKTGILANDPDNQLESFSDIQTTGGQIISFQWDSGNTYDIFVDGILNNPSSAGPPPTGSISNASTAILGKGGKDDPNTSNRSWDGEIAEFIFYGRLLSQSERESVEDYLSEKYDLAIRQITAATGGESISADDANTTYTSLTGPVIQEGFAGELTSGGTYILNAPTGYEWDTGVTPGVSVSPAYGGSTSLAVSFTSITSTQVTFTIDAASTSNPGQITISGLEVRPTTGILPNSGNIENTGTTGLGGSTNYGSLTMVAGVSDSLEFSQEPTATNVNTAISPEVRVQLVDQYGNEVEQSGVSVSMALSSGSGALSGTTPQNTNALGIAEFDDLEIDDVGSKELTASSTGLSSAVSSSFEIVNPGVLTGFKVERATGGNISSKSAGQNFNIKISAIDGSGTTVTSFTGTVVVSSSCTMGTGQGTTSSFSSGVLSSLTVSITSVGNCTITATNSSGSEDGTSNSFTVNPGTASTTTSTIVASPSVIQNDGTSTSDITVQLKDAYGNNLTSGGQTVVVSTDQGSVGSTIDNADGTHSATLTSSTSTVTATITGTLGGSSIDDNAEVEFAAFTHIWESQLGSVTIATDWENTDNWNVGSIPNSSSVILIPADPAVGNEYPVVDQASTIVSEISIESGAQITVSGGNNFEVTGGAAGSGSILGSNNDSLTVGGNLDIGSISIGTVVFNGTSEQDITSPDEFVNLEIDNSTTVNATQTLTVTGTLTLTNGELLIPSGLYLLADDKSYGSGELRFQRKISGSRGWRMLSSPVDSDIGDFLDGTITQGYSGAYYSTGSNPGDTVQPNIFWYLENYSTTAGGHPSTDNSRLRAPSSSATSLVAGRGYWVYFFGDVSGDSRYNDALPDTLDVQGQEFEGTGTEVDFGVTYTADADTGWNFVGNPYGASIDWDDNTNWTKTNIDNTIYIWDPAANGGNGEFLTWNGTTGSLGNGVIPPFQGFWVKANGASPSLKVTEDAKTTGGTFLRKQQNRIIDPVVGLEVSGNDLSKTTFVMISENGAEGKDNNDALRLLPYSNSHIEFYSVLENGTELAINHLPDYTDQRSVIPIHFDAFKDANTHPGEYTIRWPGLRSVPEQWLLLLKDHETGRITNLRKEPSYTFSYNTQAKISNTIPSVYGPAKRTNSSPSRFSLTITTEEIEANIPETLYLAQNYPNPFNPATTINFGLTEEADVLLEVYDILGRKISTIISKRMAAGNHQVRFTPKNLSSGVYIYKLATEDRLITKKMTFIK